VNYAASKGGVMLMMKSIAQEVAPYRIPRGIQSPRVHFARPSICKRGQPLSTYKELLKLIPYKRIGEPEEIGRAAVWLAKR